MQLNFLKIALFLLLFTLSAKNSTAEIKLGILPRLGAVELYLMFNPLAEYLSGETGEKVSIVIPKDFAAFKAAIRSGQMDICFANSLIYVQLKKDLDIEPLALASERKTGTKFRGIIIARKDSGINTLRDLKGKKLVFVEKDSAGGYIFQMMLLKKSGLNITSDIMLLPFAKKHDNVTLAVINGAADAGGLRENDLERTDKKVDLSRLKIIGYTEYFPNWPLFSSPGLQPEIREKIRKALLKLKPNSSQSLQILNQAGLTGFGPVRDRDYDKLRQAAKLVGAW